MHKNAVLIEVVQWIMVLGHLLNLNQKLLNIFFGGGRGESQTFDQLEFSHIRLCNYEAF